MTDYFSEYSSFIGAKGLPSPADTPYETPGFIRSKRSSRATAGSSREQSTSPPPLPPDTADLQDKNRDGRYSALDPRRFTPTLHASLVSEILNLRRELDSKNNLVENLETSLSSTRNENESLLTSLSNHAREVRKAKHQVQQMEKGTFDAVEDLVKERDIARGNAEDLKSKLDVLQKTARRQDDDAERTQRIWEAEKETWDSERRQLERRVHVTESRLRSMVDEVAAQQAAAEAQQGTNLDEADESIFKDSGLGNESDTGSIRSATPVKHRRNMSSLSYRSRSVRNSTASRKVETPEPHARPNGYSLADELGIDEEDEYDMDDFEHPDEDLEFPERVRRTMESRQSSVAGDVDSKAKRILGLTTENVDSLPSPTMRDMPKRSTESRSTLSEPVKHSFEQPIALPTVSEFVQAPRLQYVDNGYQPSPPPSPVRQIPAPEEDTVLTRAESAVPQIAVDPVPESPNMLTHAIENATKVAASPISPPETPVVDDKRMSLPRPAYSTASTQTDLIESERPKSVASKRDSLSPPSFVPAIAIHPPSSRPSSPRPYVLPPRTKNASTQAALPWTSRDVSVQTEEIRVDRRPVKIPKHLLPRHLLPSPTFQDSPQPIQSQSKRISTAGTAKIFTKGPPAPLLPSPPPQSPPESSPEMSRDNSQKDLRNMPLRPLPLPRPVLSPPMQQGEFSSSSEGPLNRSAQYGVTKPGQRSSQLLDFDKGSDASDNEELEDVEAKDLEGSIPALSRAPHGRFGLSEPPKAVPEDKEVSPERRPDTAGSYGAAPAPSIASSRANSQSHRTHNKPPAKLSTYRDYRSRSPSFASVGSSNYSTTLPLPPYPIPQRSSSRVPNKTHSEGSQSPTPYHGDVFGTRSKGSQRSEHSRQGSLRKVQSAAVIRHPARRASPQKSRRRRRQSPDLTPVQSMAFESPAPTKFPIPDLPPDLPTPLLDNMSFDYVKGSVDLGKAGTAASSTGGRVSEETGLVDAIAATMVGEWMWKYIRKRKSFGVPEEMPIAEDGTVNPSSHGTRHKRWVWLSPYERTIMWDTKQPTTGNALLGKKGRKLAIQSVLDVLDETPLPKGAELNSAFNRSILILTPARALKFTTVSAERHALWMTALSFLAQSGQLPAQIPPMPNRQPPMPPPPENVPVKRHRSPSFGRATVRDSIRLAKGKRPDLPKAVTQPVHGHPYPMMMPEEASQNDSADFPAVPRLYVGTSRHQRKRSNTSPRLPAPLNGFRSFSSTGIPSSASSALHPGSTSGYHSRPNLPSASSKSGSRRQSTASPTQPNFFEAIGTVRMEAFVDPNVRDGVLYVPAAPPAPAPTGPQPRRRRGDSNISQTTADRRRAGYVFDEFGLDPFKNF